MFPDYHAVKALVDDRQGRFQHQAHQRRFLRGRRRTSDDLAIRLDRLSAPVEATPSAARHTTSLGRTPSEVGRAA